MRPFSTYLIHFFHQKVRRGALSNNLGDVYTESGQTLESSFAEAKRSEASAALSSRSEGSGGSPRRDRETASERKEKRRGEQLKYVYTVNEKNQKVTPGGRGAQGERREGRIVSQPSTHFAAFFEIYKILTPLHRSKLKIFATFCQTFSYFPEIYVKVAIFFQQFSSNFAQTSMKIKISWVNFTEYVQKR